MNKQADKYADHAVIIHGPQGCGKTRHAAALAKHYGKTSVIEHEAHIQSGAFPTDALVLTNEPLPGAIPFAQAMADAGLQPTISAASTRSFSE